MSSMELSKGLPEAKVDRLKVEAEQLCPACEHVLWLSFYFDGFGADDKADSPTNVLKLYRAAYERPDKGMRAFYYPGLGADFDPETAALASAMGAALKVQGTQVVVQKVNPLNYGKQVVQKSAKKAAREADATVIGQAKGVANAAQDQVRGSADKVRRTLKQYYHQPQRHISKHWNRSVRRLRKEWRDLSRDLARHPWRTAATLLKKGAGLTAGYVAEGTAIRDTALVAALFNTGAATRLEAAEDDFERAVKLAKKRSKIKKINIALFGFDMGAGLALAFSKEILEEICKGGSYEGVPVHVKFMGLFDCVTNRYDDNTLTGFIPLSNSVSSGLRLLPKVERCVHYAAAHELRFYKPLTMLGADPADFRGARQERLFPGSQADVGGGVADGEDGISDKLSRLPLQMMYNRAWGAGVPMPSFEQLEQENPRLHQVFSLPADLEQLHRNYREVVKQLTTETHEIPSLNITNGLPVECQLSSVSLPTVQRALCPAPAKSAFVTKLPKDIEAEQKGHMVVYIHWLRIWYDHNRSSASQMSNRDGVGRLTAMWGTGVPIDPAANGRYQKLLDELEYLEQHARFSTAWDKNQAMNQLQEGKAHSFNLDPQGAALYWLWNNPGARQPGIERLYPMFTAHVHDSMAECPFETAFGDFAYGKHYLNLRPMQKISTEPDKTYLERLRAVYEAVVGPVPKERKPAQQRESDKVKDHKRESAT